MHYSRVDRLQSQMTKELAMIVDEELKDRPPYMITFTRSEISRDLRYARVYFSVLGGEGEIEACMEYLKRHAGAIKKIIGKKMRLKHMPDLRYVYDKTGDNVLRIGEILSKIKNESNKEDEK